MSTKQAAALDLDPQRKLQLVPDPRVYASLVARQSKTRDGSMSVEDQLAKMRDYCQRNDITIAAEYTEPDTSGRKPLDKRKGLKRAVEDVESKRSSIILTAYFDRFVRSVSTRAEVVQRVERAEGQVICLDTGRTTNATAADKLSGTLLAAIAEFYADQVGEKLAVSTQRNIDNGVAPFPHVTIAYEKIADGPNKGKLRPHPTNAPIVREAIAMRLRGASFTKLLRYFDEHEIKMSQSTVTKLFKSTLLIGEIHFGSFTPNLNAIDEPICDRATFAKLQRTFVSRGRNAKSERLLARLGVLRCETCDSRLTVSTTTRKRVDGTRVPYFYYRCTNVLCERPAMIACSDAEDFVRDETIRLAEGIVGEAHADIDVEAARVASEDAQTKLDDAVRSLLGIDSPATREVLDELQLARDVAVAEHDRLSRLAAPTIRVTAHDWPMMLLDERRDLISALVDRVVVTPGKGPGRLRVVEL